MLTNFEIMCKKAKKDVRIIKTMAYCAPGIYVASETFRKRPRVFTKEEIETKV